MGRFGTPASFCDVRMTLFTARVTLLASHVTLYVTVYVTPGR
jgi:hypothetical protein